MPSREQRQAAMKKAAELARCGDGWVRRAGDRPVPVAPGHKEPINVSSDVPAAREIPEEDPRYQRSQDDLQWLRDREDGKSPSPVLNEAEAAWEKVRRNPCFDQFREALTASVLARLLVEQKGGEHEATMDLIDALLEDEPYIQFTDAWRGLSGREQGEKASGWLRRSLVEDTP